MWVKDLVFGKADERHVDAFLELIAERIEWMNAVGIDQWNNNHYHERYPKEYFLDVARSGKMYMLSNKDDGKMVAGAVLFARNFCDWTAFAATMPSTHGTKAWASNLLADAQTANTEAT